MESSRKKSFSGQDYFTLLTNMFLHGGWMHLIGNMLFLWVFADNIEAVIGKIPFILFYFGGGLAASAAHILFNPESSIPAIGASGAISGGPGCLPRDVSGQQNQGLCFISFPLLLYACSSSSLAYGVYSNLSMVLFPLFLPLRTPPVLPGGPISGVLFLDLLQASSSGDDFYPAPEYDTYIASRKDLI